MQRAPQQIPQIAERSAWIECSQGQWCTLCSHQKGGRARYTWDNPPKDVCRSHHHRTQQHLPKGCSCTCPRQTSSAGCRCTAAPSPCPSRGRPRGMDLAKRGNWHRTMWSFTKISLLRRKAGQRNPWRHLNHAPTTRVSQICMNHVGGETHNRRSRSLAMAAPSASVLVQGSSTPRRPEKVSARQLSRHVGRLPR